MKTKFEWERIDNFHERLKVPGGWVLKAIEEVCHRIESGFQVGFDWRIAMVFIPDSNYEWEIK